MILRIHSDCMDDDEDRPNQYLDVEMMKSVVVVVRCSQFILIFNTIYKCVQNFVSFDNHFTTH